jgi:ABC-type uncharacterized transport system substrate-binding protein
MLRSQAPEPGVVLVVESQAFPYQQAAQGFEQGYGAGPYRRVQLDPDPRAREARLASLARPRLLVVIGTEAARAARRHFPETPLVYCLAVDPAHNSLTGPDTGGVSMAVDPSQAIGVLRRLLPKVQRVGVVYDQAANPPPAQSNGVRILRRNARSTQEAARLIQELLPQVDAFWMLLDPLVANPANFRLLVELSLRHQVPLLAPAAPFVEAGALLGVGPDYLQAGRRAGEIAQRLAAGRGRAGAYTERAPDFVVTINGRLARQFGIAIPADLRANILSPQDAP